MKKIECPLTQKMIDDVECFDIHMVVEGGAPEFTSPKEAVQRPDYKEICLRCPHHRDD